MAVNSVQSASSGRLSPVGGAASHEDEKTGQHVTDMEKKPHAEVDDAGSNTTIVVQEVPKRTWRSYLWDTFDKSPEERRFLFKLDAVILTFASLGYFIKYLDQVRFSFVVYICRLEAWTEKMKTNKNSFEYHRSTLAMPMLVECRRT